MAFVCLILSLIFLSTDASSLVSPPKSAVVIAFEDAYDLSLLANTISDLGTETTLVIPFEENNYYEHLISVEVIKINASLQSSDTNDAKALRLCESFISDSNVSNHVKLIQPTFIIFPAVRHDACLLPWAASISAIPVIWARGHYEELYAFIKTGMALPVHETGLLQSFIENLNLKYFLYSLEFNYVVPVQRLMYKKLPEIDTTIANLYSTTQLILWGADPILRMNSALLTQLVAEIGCHHCRGSQPLPPDIQKELVEFRAGTIVILLDQVHDSLVRAIAQKLPHDRQGLAVIWKNKSARLHNKPSNLFIHKDVDRQDLIGYSRARMVLCHCTDSEFLESAFHGTPMICFPRTMDEKRNAQRALELGFAYIEKIEAMSDTVTEIIKTIHENSKYRESARLVSQAIRDRSNHAMDRIQYWLGYVARHNGEGKNLLLPKRVSTYNEILQAVAGFLVGVFFTTLVTILFFMTQHVTESQSKKESKKKHRK
ncbi:PREDICTED: UDP-glucuronosyltransferase 1-9-like [Ceratosolen solmsi marchali]|uniref:UDP-glucuronosyltransferase 1-9-like n=1 Tax=Ceratosolen solmsi marchali TaxID=326594 RepID=A0AAJ7DVU6_9HYME|nr:PREDICTED: UDP-glucuronosyltransferase 1-9-like [Ceratosolen solmsi marchali]